MNIGQPEINIPLHLDNLRVGERYTFYRVNAPNVGIRAVLTHIFPAHQNVPDQIAYMANPPTQRTVRLAMIGRITQSYIGPNADTARLINSYLGGRKKRSRKKRKSRKSKRRRRKKIT